jgi:hypothetical protein
MGMFRTLIQAHSMDDRNSVTMTTHAIATAIQNHRVSRIRGVSMKSNQHEWSSSLPLSHSIQVRVTEGSCTGGFPACTGEAGSPIGDRNNFPERVSETISSEQSPGLVYKFYRIMVGIIDFRERGSPKDIESEP